MTYPGVYVVEERSSVHTIMGVPTSVAAFVGWAPRGPVNVAVRINNWPEFERVFGGFHPLSALSYAVYLFFVNGGSAAQIVRPEGVEDFQAKTATIKLGTSITLAAASPGLWGNALTVTLDKNNVGKEAFNLTVVDGDSGEQERFAGVTLRGPNNLASALRNSRLVRLVPPDTAKKGDADPPAKDEPKPGAKSTKDDAKPVTGTGDGGSESPPDKIDVEAGWNALASVDIFNMLCLPTAVGAGHSAELLGNAAEFCRIHRAVLIVDPPAVWADPPTFDQVTNLESVAITGSLEAMACATVYYPNLLVTERHPDPAAGGAPRVCGPSGAVAGVWARTDSSRGVWKAPAGTGAGLTGVVDLSARLIDSDIGVLNPVAINCLKTIPFTGTVVWGARTAAGADEVGSEWKYLPVRRTALFIEESLRRGTQWAVFEPNDEPLWSSLRLNVGSFMNSLYRQGAFQGSTPADAYIVKCDAQNNPQNDIDRGIINILVGFAPLKPAEFVIIHIEQLAGQLQT
jgi:phage tail sheath protein FI